MRKRIQHHRGQRPSRVQLVRFRAPGQGVNETGKLVGANVDGEPLVWAVSGERATFDTPKQAEREALFALACRHLDAAAWAALRAKASAQAIDDLAFVDLLELGLIDDDGKLNAAGAMVIDRLDEPDPEVPPGLPNMLTAGELIAKLRDLAEASLINLDGPILAHVQIAGDSCSHVVELVDVVPNGWLAQLDLEPIEVSS